MKILLVITKAEVGGAQMSVLNLAREFASKGHLVEFLFGDGDFLPEELDKENIKYNRAKFLKRTHNPLAGMFFILEIFKFLKKNKFDVVHFNSSNALLGAIGAKLADRKIKTVFTFRGMSMLDDGYQKNKCLKNIYFWFFKIMMFFVDAPVFVSRANLTKGVRDGLTKKGVLVYNGLDSERVVFQEKEEAREGIIDLCKKVADKEDDGFGDYLKSKYIIGSIGRLDYAKNYEFIIGNFYRILKINPKAVFVIIGEGPEREKYEKIIKDNRLGDKVFLLGSVHNASRFIKGFDLFVLPSRYEGLSITLIETLFSGIPALVSDVGGNRETFMTDNELYELDNRDEFLQKFQRLQYEELVGKVRENNKKQIDKFLISRVAGEYLRVYKK